MVYKFIMISEEVDDFVREIKIDSDATFYDLHKIILKSVGYTDDQMTSFFVCDDDWEKEIEITLEDMSTSSDEDTWVMDKTPLSELIEDEKQKLMYVYDQLTERAFLLEVTEIITGQDLKTAVCSAKHGNPPVQTIDFNDAAILNATTSTDLGEDFYGDQDYNLDEFDPDGFEINGGSDSISIDPETY